MKSIKIIHPGIATSIQDAGRVGYAFYAIPRSGVMDQFAYNKIKSILGRNPSCSVIECTLQAPKIRFNAAFTLVVSGADLHWKINDDEVKMDTLIKVNKGDLLTGSFARSGFRSYIGFADEMVATKHYGSASAYSYAGLGGNNGQLLTQGQVIKFTESEPANLTSQSQYRSTNQGAIVIHEGPEFDWLDTASKLKLTKGEFVISPQSNRMGARLQGPNLSINNVMTQSVPVLPGFIQLLPSGQLIVILQDGQTTGGYPRIGYLSEQSLSIFNQAPIGKKVNFELG